MGPSFVHQASVKARTVGWLLLLAASIVALMSFGGQLVLAPILVPLQWVAARHAEGAGRIVFTILATLLMVEVGWMLGYMATGHGLVSVLWSVAWGTATGILFYRTAVDGPSPTAVA